jgi:hypothetical protein
MIVRILLPVAAAALLLVAGGDGYAQSPSPTQVRPAQMPRGACDELLRAVEIEMPSAVGLRVPDARDDISEARQLCNSGQEQEGWRSSGASWTLSMRADDGHRHAGARGVGGRLVGPAASRCTGSVARRRTVPARAAGSQARSPSGRRLSVLFITL